MEVMLKEFSHVLVTGASGFIGRRLCRRLKELNKIITVVLRDNKAIDTSKAQVPWDQAIIYDFNTNNNFAEQVQKLPNNNIDAVIHLANIAHADNILPFETYWRVNVLSTLELLNYSLNTNVKSFLYLSSIKAVANPCINQMLSKDESYIAWPDCKDFYGISKRLAEDLLQKFALTNKLHTCILRPSLVYGPDVKGNLKLLINAAKKNILPNLPEINNKFSMVHIDDLIDAMLVAIYNPKAHGQIFIVTDNQAYSTKQICKHINKQFAKKNFLMLLPIPYCLLKAFAKIMDLIQLFLSKNFYFNSQVLKKLFTNSYFTSQKIQTDLNWQPKYTFFDSKI